MVSVEHHFITFLPPPLVLWKKTILGEKSKDTFQNQREILLRAAAAARFTASI